MVLVGAGSHSPFPGISTEMLPWSEEVEREFSQKIDAGIMPLMDGPFERGKCGYKLVQYMAGGIRWTESRLLILPVRWIGLGLLGATLTGIGAVLAGYPFLTSYFAYHDVPILGAIPVSSALLFDLGVFALVIGATVLILIALAHQSIRSHRPASVEAASLAGER